MVLMKPIVIIGLGSSTGPESGKSTAAQAIATAIQLLDKVDVHRLSFAQPLKAIGNGVIEQLMGTEYPEELSKSQVILEYSDDEFGPSEQVTVRDVYVVLGMLCREHLGRDVWVDAAFSTINEEHHTTRPQVYLIDDVRFRNELDRIKSYGGKVFNVMRVDGQPTPDSTDLVPDDFDDIISNDMTPAGLVGEIQAVLTPFLKERLG